MNYPIIITFILLHFFDPNTLTLSPYSIHINVFFYEADRLYIRNRIGDIFHIYIIAVFVDPLLTLAQ